MKKVLLVGGAGYVGSVLAEELLERGYSVKILDRLYFGQGGLEKIRDRVELIVGDMRSIDARIFEEVRAVVNVGGLSNDPTAEFNPTANHEMNTEATISLAQMSKKAGVYRYIFASSCSIYDKGVGEESKDVIQDEQAEVEPRSIYSASKLEAEKRLLAMVDEHFCPVILRKGTLYGFSPRMRYDLVLNTFIKDALTKGKLTLYYGGEMWRPLISVQDVARAYIASIEAPADKVRGEIFNVSFENMRISELALRTKKTLAQENIKVEVVPVYSYKGIRNYRVSSAKIEKVLGIKPKVTIEESIIDMVKKIKEYNYTDFENPRYYNINWMRLLEEADSIVKITGSVF
jgi:nucleoside-diphosphate-sugar epimerase